MPSSDKRSCPRLQAAPGTYATYPEGAGTVRDLSVGGLFIEDSGGIAEGTRLALTLHLEGDPIPCRAVVRRAIPGRGVGVQLLEVSRDLRERLARYCYNLSRATLASGRTP
jgi:c-di-GMP-binding flagellar brake protein YcgR